MDGEGDEGVGGNRRGRRRRRRREPERRMKRVKLHLKCNAGGIVGVGGEYLRVQGREGGVSGNANVVHPTRCFQTDGNGSCVEEENVLEDWSWIVAAENGGKTSCTNGSSLDVD